MRMNKSLPARIAPQPGWGNNFWLALIPVLVCTTLLFAPVPVVFGQVIQIPERVLLEPISGQDAVRILNGVRNGVRTPELPAPSAPEIPFFTYSTFASRNGKTYLGSIVGGSPFSSTTNNKTTTVDFVIVPLVLRFDFGGGVVITFDPTAEDPDCLGAGNTALSLTQRSPLFQPVSFTMNGVNVGNTTYPDAFQRGEFAKIIGPNYHLAFNVTTLPAQTVTLPASATHPATASVFQIFGLCGHNTGTTNIPGGLGVVDVFTFDLTIRSLITQLHLNAAQFPLFLLYNSVESAGDSVTLSVAGGYHNSTTLQVDNPGQTYGVADFENRTLTPGIQDISIASHEVAEWINDPSVNNLVPPWGGQGEIPAGRCLNILEVGDPLTFTSFPSGEVQAQAPIQTQPRTMTLNGFTYHLQELAFFSWFYGKPSIGAGGLFSDNGTFKTDAGAICPFGIVVP